MIYHLFFKVRLPISIKRLCAWLNIFSFQCFFSSLIKKGSPVLSFFVFFHLLHLCQKEGGVPRHVLKPHSRRSEPGLEQPAQPWSPHPSIPATCSRTKPAGREGKQAQINMDEETTKKNRKPKTPSDSDTYTPCLPVRQWRG